ncbi:MAG: YlmH/Sll1252 family protein [Oscillospiraceae bacterium]
MDKGQKEKEYFLAALRNQFELSRQGDCPRFSCFLNEQQQVVAMEIAKKSQMVFRFFGGFSAATRKMLGVFPTYIEPTDDLFPIVGFTVSYPSSFSLSHRDFLGTLMAQQIKRETVGDIVIQSGTAYVFIEEKLERVLSTQIDKVGGVGVSITAGTPKNITVEQLFKELRGTLASLRLDASVSLVTGISREKAAKLIASGAVLLNYTEKSEGSVPLSEGDILSVRGYGKFRLSAVGGQTKKGRTSVQFDAYSN